MAKTTTNESTTNMENTTKNDAWVDWCGWIIKLSMRLLPWLMLLHNLLYIVFPSWDHAAAIDLAWSNLYGVVYLIGMQAAIDAGFIVL